ncbi:MAG TPA: DUF4153 domain-containing protein [Croceibacterium sp.]|nr:DUF4153 domain-containing protein [Solirubrobacterales bacterium]HYD25469.1 DUF4153 domain-containing protein [Croceibacterium sp.]
MSDDATQHDGEPDFSVAQPEAAPEWPLRPWLLAGLLGLAGLLIHLVTGGNDDVPWQMATAAFLFFGAIAAAFTLEHGRWKEPALFALAAGLVMAGLAWRAVQYGEYLPDEEYGFMAGVVATALALPLFQAGFHRRRFATPYAEIYGHVWTDAISAAAALAFTGLSWIVLVLMSELFHLLRIDLLRDLMDDGWFGWTFSGLAAGAALGTVRNQLKVLATMQTVVLLVASLLAVPLALGLVVFLLATVVSGPQVLWDATRSATPLLLACAAGAFVLANAIARHGDEAMTGSRAMRIAGWVLAAVILPLALFAAVSMGLRIGQYGLAPERLWGLVAIVVACVCGVAYWAALIRGRNAGWAGHLRKATFHLGLVVCGLAILLALPILDFGAISARNQVSRLENGRVTPEQFDFTALRWDFGSSGRKALERLSRSGNAKVAELAQAALTQSERVYATFDETNKTRADFKLRVQPDDGEVRERVLDYLVVNPYLCSERCVALDLGEARDGGQRIAIVQGGSYQVIVARPGMTPVQEPVAGGFKPLRADSVVEVSEARVIRIDGDVIGSPIPDD